MHKREATKFGNDDDGPTFAGYLIDEHGRVIKGSKVNLPKSIRIELNELCMRERLSLEMSNDNYTIIVASIIANEVSLVLRNHSAVFDHIKSVHIKAVLSGLRQKCLRDAC